MRIKDQPTTPYFNKTIIWLIDWDLVALSAQIGYIVLSKSMLQLKVESNHEVEKLRIGNMQNSCIGNMQNSNITINNSSIWSSTRKISRE